MKTRRLRSRWRPSWRHVPDVVPWLDGPDAVTRLRSAQVADRDRSLLEQWIRDGYFVIDDAFDDADLDAAVGPLAGAWTAERPFEGLVLRDVRKAAGEPARNLEHGEVLALPEEERLRMASASRWRVHGFDELHEPAARLFNNSEVRRLASLVLGEPAHPAFSVSFVVGSEQPPHQDMATNHVWPMNHMVLAWIACEDVSPGSGALALYPGSHHEPMFTGFTDYPQTSLRTCDEVLAEQYKRWVQVVASRYQRREFLARKGQVLLFHGMLIHGGTPVTDPAATRNSMVINFFTRGANRSLEVHGPFRW